MAQTITLEQFLMMLDLYERNFYARKAEIPYELKTSIVRQIVRTRSIDTTRFIQAVDFRLVEVSNDSFRYYIDAARNSEVYYDGYVEFNGDKRNWVGRFNYRDGIQNANIESITDSIADQTFAR